METTTSKRTLSQCREWERRRRNTFNDAITRLGQIVKAIQKANCPNENVEDVQYPKIEIVQKAIICLTNCAQEKTQLKAEILALQVQLDTVKNQCGNRKDASTQVYFGVTKKHKDGKYVKLLMLNKSKGKKGKEKPIVKEPSKNNTIHKLPMLLPRTNVVDKKGPENTIVVLPAAPYLFPQRPLLFPTVPPAIVFVDSNLQPLNKAGPVVRNSGDVTKTTMVNILPISAYSRPLSATKSKKSNVKLKGDVLKKSKKKLNPSTNIEKDTKNNNDSKSQIQSTEKESCESTLNKTIIDYDKKVSKPEQEAKNNSITPNTSSKDNKPQAVDTKTDIDCKLNMNDESSKINGKHKDNQVSTAKDNTKCTEPVVKELPVPITTVASNVKNIENMDENTKTYKIDSIKTGTENKEKINKLPNILDATLCDNVVDGGNARLELAEEFLATSPTAAFLMSFPLVSGNRADSPAEDCQNTSQTSSIQVIGKDNQKRNELVPPPGPFFEKPSNSEFKLKTTNKTPCSLLNKQNNQQKYVGSIVTKETNTLVTTNSLVTKTIPTVTLPNVTSENPFLNLSMPSLITTNCTLADTALSLDFDCSINKTVPSQSTSYVNSNNFFYKGDPFGAVKSTIYSTSSISSSHEFNGLGLYPCAMEKYPSKNKPEYSSVDDNLMKMGSSRLTYDIDLGWSHKGFDFVNCTTSSNTFNKDTLLTTSTPFTTSYNPFNPDFHIPLVSSTNKKDNSSKPSFTDSITSFYSQPTSLWTDDMHLYTNSNISKNLSSRNSNYTPLEPVQTNVKSNSTKHYDTKLAETNISGLKPSNNTTGQQIMEKYTKKSPSKMHINWMTSEIRPMQSNCNPVIHSEIKETHKTTYNQSDHSNKKQDQSDGNYFPISMHNFPTQTGQDEFQVWPSARTLGTTEISIEPPPINLPTLVGDLALGPHDKKKTADAANRAQADIQNCGNFLSVTQLMNRSSDNMTSRYHNISNIDTAKSIPVKHNFVNDSSRKGMTSHMENHITQPCYTFNEPKVGNPYENMNQFSHTTKAKTNKTEKSSKTSHKNNYSTEALLRGASCTQKVQDTGSSKFMMPAQKYTDYNATQDSSVAQVSHFPPILDYSDNNYASQQYAGTTLYNTTTNTISNSFYSNFMPGSSNLMPSNYASGPFTGEFIDYNQSAECNYTNHKYEELKMRNNTVFQPEKVPSHYKSSRRESGAKHKLDCSKKESNKKYQSKKAKINNEIEEWNDQSHLLWQNKTSSKKHSNLMSEELPFPNYVSNQMPTQYQPELFNSHLMSSNVQSMSHNVDRSLASFPVTSRANFNLSTIFPEITMKVQ